MSRTFRLWPALCVVCKGLGCPDCDAHDAARGYVLKASCDLSDDDLCELTDEERALADLERTAEWFCDWTTNDNGYVTPLGETFDVNGDEERVLAVWRAAQGKAA